MPDPCSAYLCKADAFCQFNGRPYCFAHVRMLMNVEEGVTNKPSPIPAYVSDEVPAPVCENCSS